MLPAVHRLTDSRDHRAVVRTGRRAGSRTLVVHLVDATDAEQHGGPPRVGLVVSKAVGNAVVRNRVQRRLRHLAREQLPALPGSCALVIRALPPAAGADSRELGADLVRCLERVLEAGSAA